MELFSEEIKRDINRGAKGLCWGSFTLASASCSYFSNYYRGKKPFQQVQKKSEAGNFWNITRETSLWFCKVTWGLCNRRGGECPGTVLWKVLYRFCLSCIPRRIKTTAACSPSFRLCFLKPMLAYGLHFQSTQFAI